MAAAVEALVQSHAGSGNVVRLPIVRRGELRATREIGAQDQSPSGPTLNVNPAEARLAVPSVSGNSRAAFAAFFVLSLLAHVAIYASLNSRPAPMMASVGEEVITVEIVVGSNSAAGLAETAEPTEVENPVVTETTKPEEPKEQRATETEAPQPAPESEVALARVEPKLEDTPVPTERHDDPVAEPTPPQIPTVPSSGIGHGTSAPDAKYFGKIAAHLARRKQYPPEARSKRQQGTGTVKFTIDATGQVSAIELVRATGVAALDREIEAMVRRAAPFPPPPGGMSVSFAAPISFRIN